MSLKQWEDSFALAADAAQEGKALAIIREAGLFLPYWPTWTDYLSERWQLTVRQGDALIGAGVAAGAYVPGDLTLAPLGPADPPAWSAPVLTAEQGYGYVAPAASFGPPGAVRDSAGVALTDDAIVINYALQSYGRVRLLPGNFNIDSSIVMATGNMLEGSGENNTILNTTQTALDVITFTDQRFITIRDLQINGPGTGTGKGIAGHHTTPALANLRIVKVFIANMGAEGLYLETPITSVFQNIRSQNNGFGNAAADFHIISGTSCTFDSCYANNGGGIGFHISSLSYSVFNACAADTITANNNGGYFISGCHALTFNGCGNEASVVGFKVTGSIACVLNSCRVFSDSQRAFLVTGNSQGITINSPNEDSPQVGVLDSIRVDVGSTAVITNPQVVTAMSFGAGTAFVITNTGGVVH